MKKETICFKCDLPIICTCSKCQKKDKTQEEIKRDLKINKYLIRYSERKLAEFKEKEKQLLKEQEKRINKRK